MSTFDVQGIEIAAPFSTAFRYIADPANLPEWTHAFRHVVDGRATMEPQPALFRSALASTHAFGSFADRSDS